MGTGQSAQVQDHLQRWESALRELERVSANSRRLVEQDRIYAVGGAERLTEGGGGEEPSGGSGGGGGRRPSSLVSFNHASQQQQQQQQQEGPSGTSTASLPAAGAPGAAGRARSNGSVSNVAAHKHGRQHAMEIKRGRVNLFKTYEAESPDDEVANQMQCGHFGALAVALSYLLEGHRGCKDRRKLVTVENIFFAAQVPLHFLHTGPPHLPIMSDIVGEFLEVDNRFRDDYSLETLHLDILPTVGQVGLGLNEVGDRQTRMQLPEFRRAITQDCEEETQVIRVVNYDPYVLEQEMLVDAFEDEDDLNSPLTNSIVGGHQHHHMQQQRRHSKKNDGAYAVIVDVRNAVQLMVTIAEGIVGDSLHVKLTEVPAASLFKAMMCAEEGHRARGFIRIFRKDIVPDFTRDEMDRFWTPELCSGKVLGTIQHGTHASVVSHHISPHIVGVAWAMHLLAGVRPGTHGYGSGLPVSEIIREMKFPAEVFLDGDLPLEQVFEYAVEFMRRAGRPHEAHLYPVLTKISREDAVPTISVFDLESILIDVKRANEDPECPEHVMVIQYNAGVAHNVLYVVEQPQWCVLCGYDQEAQTVMLLDAHPKTFSRTWCCPLDRLHKAMTGSGYIVFSKTSATTRGRINSSSSNAKSSNINNSHSNGLAAWTNSGMIDSDADQQQQQEQQQQGMHLVGAPQRLAPMVRCRLHLLDQQKEWGFTWGNGGAVATTTTTTATTAPDSPKAFNYPHLPLMPTMIALACTRLGLFTTFEDVVHTLPFEISTLLIRLFTLESMHVCLSQYLHFSGKDKEVAVRVVHSDPNVEGNTALTLQAFTELIDHAVTGDPQNTCLIVDFHASMLLVRGAANPFSSLGIVLAHDKESDSVKIADSNPNGYLRTWTVPLTLLYSAITDSPETVRHRSRGCIQLTRRNTARSGSVSAVTAAPSLAAAGGASHDPIAGEYCRDLKLELLPVQNVFHVSPSPHFQGMSFAFSQLGCFYSPEEIFYEAYLKTMNDQRRRGSQAFAWRDVDVSLSVINERIDAAFMAQVCKMFLESRAAGEPAAAPSPSSASGGASPLTALRRTAAAVDPPPHSKRHMTVEVLEDADEGLDALLRAATTSTDMVLLLNYSVAQAHRIPAPGSSVALVKAYDPARQLVELWDAEYTVFGLSFTVTVEQLIALGELDTAGHCAYGLVKFAWKDSPLPKKRGLMAAPTSAEEEAELEEAVATRDGEDPYVTGTFTVSHRK